MSTRKRAHYYYEERSIQEEERLDLRYEKEDSCRETEEDI
jgi:hypothetical protein